jgi:hypothetical protein
MTWSGLTIERERLTAVQGRVTAKRALVGSGSTNGNGDRPSRRGPVVVPDDLIAETATRYPECTCENHGLHAGMRVDQLWSLHEGCTRGRGRTPGWICPRLDTIRRRCGV